MKVPDHLKPKIELALYKFVYELYTEETKARMAISVHQILDDAMTRMEMPYNRVEVMFINDRWGALDAVQVGDFVVPFTSNVPHMS